MLSFDSCHLATALCHIFVKDFHEQGLSQVSVLLNLSYTLLKNGQMYFKNFAMSTPLPFCSVIQERVWSIPATHMWGKRLSKMFILSIIGNPWGSTCWTFFFIKLYVLPSAKETLFHSWISYPAQCHFMQDLRYILFYVSTIFLTQTQRTLFGRIG